MKFKISKLGSKHGDKNGKSWTLYNFQNLVDRQYYSCFAQSPYTDSFTDGFEFEADFTEKPNPKGGTYKNIQWPKKQAQSSNAQLDRIEAKIDKLLSIVPAPRVNIPGGYLKSGVVLPSGTLQEVPYAGSPDPTDEDAPF